MIMFVDQRPGNMKPISESTWFVAASGDRDEPKKEALLLTSTLCVAAFHQPLPIWICIKS